MQSRSSSSIFWFAMIFLILSFFFFFFIFFFLSVVASDLDRRRGATARTVVLRSSDGQLFEVDEAVAMQSRTISHIIEEGSAGDVVPLPAIPSNILAKVVEYCKKQAGARPAANTSSGAFVLEHADSELVCWNAEFMRVDQATLFGLILAANYLDIKGLLDLACQTIAEMIKGKTPEEIRNTFIIDNDLTPEEEEMARRENEWATE